MGSMFGGGGGAQTVNPPKPLKINLGNMESDMVGADQAAWQAADDYNNQYYPNLTGARDKMINQAYDALTGPLDPALQNTFVNAGNMGSISAFGQGNPDFGLGGGGEGSWGGSSMAKNASAASVASSEQGYQDYNRSLFEQLNTMYAPRTFGMTPEDAANVFTFNNTQMNNYLQQKFAAQTQSYYSQVGASAQQGAATTGLIGTLGAAAITAAIAA
jgi:hypothetical protein